MTPTEWAVIAGVIGGAGGSILGYGIAWGRTRTKVDAHERAISQLAEQFAACQKRGTECTASTRVLLETNVRLLQDLQTNFAQHKASVHQHHESADIHTTSEWRRNVMDRFDRVEAGLDKKLEAQTDILLQRIEQVERLVRNGSGK